MPEKNKQEQPTQETLDAAPNHVRIDTVEDRLVNEIAPHAKGIGREALLALYTAQHIDVSGSGHFAVTHDHGQPALY